METLIFIIFAICLVWYWVPDIVSAWYYCIYQIEIFFNDFKCFLKYIWFKIKNIKNGS